MARPPKYKSPIIEEIMNEMDLDIVSKPKSKTIKLKAIIKSVKNWIQRILNL